MFERLRRLLRPPPRTYPPVVRERGEEAWLDKLRAAYVGLFERLEWNREGRVIAWGNGLGGLLPRLLEAGPLAGKVLAVPPAGFDRLALGRVLEGRPGLDRVVWVDGEALPTLRALPAGSVDLALAGWGLAGDSADALRAAAGRALLPGGRLGLLEAVDGTPEIPLRALRRAFRELPELPARLEPLGLPRSARDLRRRLERAGFAPPRVWQDGLTLAFAHGEEAFAAFLRLGGELAFGTTLPEATFLAVRRAAIRDLEERWRWDGEIPVTLEFVGAVAVRAG
ncbi:MAG: hypothetical protein HZA54_07935 [Planctomycetes bacterium]|nr:hypothetical protein [Planctomycetota bacterium]